MGQLAQAHAIYHQVLKLQPNHFDALHMLGVLAGQTKNPAQAVAWISKAIEVNPNIASAYSNRGNALNDLKQHQAAIESYDKAIALKPNYANAYAGRGKALYELKQYQAAIESFDKAVAIKPGHADAYCDRGLALNDLKQHQAAIASYERAIAIQPNHALACCNRGVALYESRQYQAAIESFNKALFITPNYADAYFNRGNALNKLKQHQAAIESFDKAIAIKPDNAEAYGNRGKVFHELKQYQAAIESYAKAIAIKPDNAEAYTNRGVALYCLKQYQAAIATYDKAIAIEPGNAAAYYNRGIALNDLRQHQAAIESYDKACAIKPDYADAFANCGVALLELNQLEAAIESFNKAIVIKPDNADAYANRGNAQSDLKQYEAAIASFDKAITINPDQEFLPGARLNAKMHICDWRDVENEMVELTQNIQQNGKYSTPLPVLALTTSLVLQRKAAMIWANEMYPANLELGSIPRRARGEKIRIAYFSMDFNNHPVSFLTAGLFESHDRSRFEVYAFSFGPDTKDEMRVRLEAAFDKFIDVQNRSDKEIAELARQMQIDIAIDLAGFTSGSRTGIFALRAAPLQVNYLGFPGTMGADYIDYLIADKTLIPEESQQHYAEKIAYLPHSYQVNDSQRRISDKVFTREELGLPRSAFVFCCFNNNYKITPSTFDGWMRIVNQVEGSVLWLFEDNPSAADNLRQQAQHRGVSPERLVFAKRMSLPEHLARHRAADLFIDTLPYNAHTTASDALWAGLPVLTCAGEALASRVAASVLSAVDLPELITTTQKDYEALAIKLATNPEQLQAIRQKLQRNRLATPLFDTRLFTRHIEDAYTQMVERYQAGLAPDHLYVGKPSA